MKPTAELQKPIIKTELPGPKAKEIIEADAKWVTPSYPRPDYKLVAERGYGVWIEDPDGNVFLDCNAGVAVCSTGHCHPEIVEAITRQTETLIHLCGTDYYYRQMPELGKKLSEICPIEGDTKTHFANSGAEAIETALKLAMYHTRRQKFISFYGSFHGRTLGALSLTSSKKAQRLGFMRQALDVVHVPYPNKFRHFADEMPTDEEKISVALHKILEEDPSLHFDRDAQTKEFILSGSGQLHIETVVDKLKNRYHVEVALHPPKVPYKETITAQVEVQGRHKKQSGGRGQFGDCKCVFEPLDRGAGFEWVDKIFGGAIPQNFRPAVEKGILEAAQGGAVAGYPLVDFRVTLIDGSYHTVDSDEHSFRAAGRKAFRAAMEKARPTLLEPIMDVEVFCPQEVSGDIMGDLNSRRGRVQGMDMRGKQQVIKAQVPLSEMLDYQSKLNSVTQARGSYHMQFSHYDPLPHNLADKVIQEAVAAGRVRAHDEDE